MNANDVEFSHLVISLAQGVKVGLGEVPETNEAQKNTNLDMAKYSLGALRMLKEKTQGNLNEDEQKLIDALLNEFSSMLESAP